MLFFSQVTSKFPSLEERVSVPDGRDDGRCHDWPDPWDLPYASAAGALANHNYIVDNHPQAEKGTCPQTVHIIGDVIRKSCSSMRFISASNSA